MVRNSEATEGILPLSQSSHKHVGRLATRRQPLRAHLHPNFEREKVASSVAASTLLVVTPRVNRYHAALACSFPKLYQRRAIASLYLGAPSQLVDRREQAKRKDSCTTPPGIPSERVEKKRR
jgi:hypothetical protein